MNGFLRFLIFSWMMLCALISWVFVNVVGSLFLLSSNAQWVHPIVLLASFTIVITMIKSSLYVLLKSNPADYIDAKVERILRIFQKRDSNGETKI